MSKLKRILVKDYCLSRWDIEINLCFWTRFARKECDRFDTPYSPYSAPSLVPIVRAWWSVGIPLTTATLPRQGGGDMTCLSAPFLQCTISESVNGYGGELRLTKIMIHYLMFLREWGSLNVKHHYYHKEKSSNKRAPPPRHWFSPQTQRLPYDSSPPSFWEVHTYFVHPTD